MLFSTACIKLLIPKHVNDLNDSANSLSAYEKFYRFAASAHRVLFQSDIIMVQLQKVCKLILNLNAHNNYGTNSTSFPSNYAKAKTFASRYLHVLTFE